MIHKDKISAAIKRNLAEIVTAVHERRALIGIEKADADYGWNFFRISYNALFNDMVAHAIKVLDDNNRSATFWFIYKHYQKKIDAYLISKNTNIASIKGISARLKIIRNHTHFHIDQKGVLDPKAVWKSASIKGNDLAVIIDIIQEVLEYIHKEHFGDEFPIPDYNGEDVTRIIKLAKKSGGCP